MTSRVEQYQHIGCTNEPISPRYRPALLALTLLFLLLLTMVIVKTASMNTIVDGSFRIAIVLCGSAALYLYARMVLLSPSTHRTNAQLLSMFDKDIYDPFRKKYDSVSQKLKPPSAQLALDNALDIERVQYMHDRLERHLRQNERLKRFFKIACILLFVTIGWTACVGLWNADPSRDAGWTRAADIVPASLIFLLLLWIKARTSHVRHADSFKDRVKGLQDQIKTGLEGYREARTAIWSTDFLAASS